jgi:DNA-binding transcriptional MerR regulator
MDEPLFTIGEVARRTGLSVKTIRFYADSGLVPPADRSGAGYRLYDSGALARLAFVRTLRDLGIDLATIRDIQRNVAGETHIRRIAAAHADALDVQIRTLRLRRAVLRAVADRGATPEEMETMHRLARLSEDERRRIIHDFLDEVFGGLQVDPGFEARMRSATPELPDEPTPEQVDAWIELAELVADDDFRRRIRAMAEHASHERDGSVERPDPETFRRTAALVGERGGAALAAGIDPRSAEARPALDEIAAAISEASGEKDSPAFRAALAERFASGSDPRAERYWQLLAIINGWSPVPTTVPAWEWAVAGLRA